MNNFHKTKRRDFFKWALASGFSAYLLDRGQSWAQNSADVATKQADIIAFNGRITTLDSQQASASALAIKDGKFVAVGNDDEVLQLRGTDTEVIDLNGKRVIPGLNDSHLHVTRGGRFYNLELRWDGVPTLAMALDMLREQAERTPQGEWVRVIGGWSPYQFAEKRMPTVQELNSDLAPKKVDGSSQS